MMANIFPRSRRLRRLAQRWLLKERQKIGAVLAVLLALAVCLCGGRVVAFGEVVILALIWGAVASRAPSSGALGGQVSGLATDSLSVQT
jgi:hypothetical protein